MKTQEQIKKEVITYLAKTSKHTFIKPKATFKWGNEKIPGNYEYDYNEFTYFAVMDNSEKENDGEIWAILENDKTTSLDINYYIKYYGNNAKDVISKVLFQNKKMKSIKSNKKVKTELKSLLG